MASAKRVDDLCSQSNPQNDVVARFTGERPADGAGPRALEVAHLWGEAVLAVKHLREGRLTLGSAPGEWLVPPEDLPSPSFPLFAFEADAVVCTFSELWAGTLSDGGEPQPLAGLGPRLQSAGLGLRRLELRPGERIVLNVGASTFTARLVSAAARVRAIAPKIDKPFLGIGTFNAFVGGMLMLLALTTNPPPRAETELDEGYLMELMLQKPEELVQRETPKAQEAGGEKAKREEGRTGDLRAKVKQARGEKRSQESRDREIAENSGVLGALNDSAELAETLGGGANTALLNGVGGLIGPRGTQNGPGLGERGPGIGGGGRTDGLSDGQGPGTRGRHTGYGEEGTVLDPKTDGKIDPGTAMVMGSSIDRAQIDAVIRRNISRFRYCYQRQLTRFPELQGKVVVKFSIARDGSVSAAETKSSTIGNSDVDACMNTVMRSLTFPEPRGGGVVIVSYPFLFAPG